MIVRVPDPVLRERCASVTPTVEVRGLVVRLHAAIAWSAQQGRVAAGLAAPQIGEPVRVFVLAHFPHAFVNPRVVRLSREAEVALEGCLSLPADVLVPVLRSRWVKVGCVDEHGRPHTYKLHHGDARAALHELDHLDGVLITDRAA